MGHITIKRRMMLTVCCIFVTTTAATALLTYLYMIRDLRKDLGYLARDQDRQFNAILKADSEGLARAHLGLTKLDQALELFAQRRKGALLTAMQPLFREMKSNNNITHMYFIDPDGTVFLRVHKPQEAGDKLTRATFLKASRTGKTASGIELGQNFFSLRCVRPISYHGKPLGYLEVAEEIDHVFNQMRRVNGYDVSLFLADDYIRQHPTHVRGERFGRFHILYATQRALSERLAARLKPSMIQAMHGYSVSVVDLDGKKYAVGMGPVVDAFGNRVGVLFSQREVTHSYLTMWRAVITITAVSSSILLVALLILAATLRKSLRLFRLLGVRIEEVTTDWDLTRRLEVPTSDEMGSLARSFNLMLAELERQKNDMKHQLAQRKLAEETAKKSEHRFKALFDSQPSGVFILNAASEYIVDANPAAIRMIGLPREHIVGRSSHEFFVPAEAESSSGAGSDTDSPYPAGELFDLKNRDISIIKSRVSLTLDGDLFVIENFIDITERRRTEQALRESETTLRTLMDVMPVGVWWFDNDGRIEYVNRYFEECLGYTLQEVGTMQQWYQLAYPDPEYRRSYLAKKDAAFEQARKSGAPVPPREAKVTCKDGTVRHVIINNQVQKNRTLAILTDITEHEFINSQLLKVQKLESLGVLAGGIAHDFNNILTSIMGSISFSQMLLDESHKARTPLAMAEKASHRAAELARQLLTFARGGEPIKKVVPVRRLVDESVSLVLRGTKVKGEVEICEELNAIEADESQMNQAFNNLVINAVQAMPEGGTLTVKADNFQVEEPNRMGLEAGAYVRISFQDEGCGISEEDQRRIFDPYFTTKPAGTGLGLASVHSIILRHGGHIEVSSAHGKGTTFTVYLRACAVPPPAQAPKPSDAAAGSFAGASILVMDDEEMILSLASQMLEHLGYRVTTCASGEEAVSLYRSAREAGNPYAAAIMDLTVPGGMGGKEAAREILAIDPQARLIVSSGYSNDPVMAQYGRYGFSGAVMKPYQVGDVVHALDQVMTALALEA